MLLALSSTEMDQHGVQKVRNEQIRNILILETQSYSTTGNIIVLYINFRNTII